VLSQRSRAIATLKDALIFRGIGLRQDFHSNPMGAAFNDLICVIALLQRSRLVARSLGAAMRTCDLELGDLYDDHLEIDAGRAADVLHYKRVMIFKFR
jgi:hypothetical protein